jgi:hypothetical protein
MEVSLLAIYLLASSSAIYYIISFWSDLPYTLFLFGAVAVQRSAGRGTNRLAKPQLGTKL